MFQLETTGSLVLRTTGNQWGWILTGSGEHGRTKKITSNSKNKLKKLKSTVFFK